jgi:hypothetical protein
LSPHVDKLIKLLKTKAFILEKFLDTAFRCPIRFRQKVLMVFFEPPLELFSLERKGRPVAGRPFRWFMSLRSTPLYIFHSGKNLLPLTRAARRVIGLPAFLFMNKFCRSTPHRFIFSTLEEPSCLP